MVVVVGPTQAYPLGSDGDSGGSVGAWETYMRYTTARDRPEEPPGLIQVESGLSGTWKNNNRCREREENNNRRRTAGVKPAGRH